MSMRIYTIVISFTIFLISCNIQKKQNDANRNSIHFKSNDMYLGAPDELLYFNGEYHLFYPCYKDSSNGKTSFWGHSKSTDLLHWENVAIIAKKENEVQSHSTKVVVDLNNTSGLGNENPPLLKATLNTFNNTNVNSLALAYSLDYGISWEYYPDKNILLNKTNSPLNDPKIFWHEESQRWILMAISGYEIHFYASDNLLSWDFISSYSDFSEKKGNWTNLEFLPINLENSNKKKWVLMFSSDANSPSNGTGVQYFIGDFDGNFFYTKHNKAKWLDNGGNFISGVGFTNFYEENEPTLFMGFLSNIEIKENAKFSLYTLPRKLTIVTKYNDYYLKSKPLTNNILVNPTTSLTGKHEFSEEVSLFKNTKAPCEINLLFDLNNRRYLDFAEIFGVTLNNDKNEKLVIGYNNTMRYFFISFYKSNGKSEIENLGYAPAILDNNELDLKIIIDNSSIEIFAMNGFITLSKQLFNTSEFNQVNLFADGGKMVLLKGDISELKLTNFKN